MFTYRFASILGVPRVLYVGEKRMEVPSARSVVPEVIFPAEEGGRVVSWVSVVCEVWSEAQRAAPGLAIRFPFDNTLYPDWGGCLVGLNLSNLRYGVTMGAVVQHWGKEPQSCALWWFTAVS